MRIVSVVGARPQFVKLAPIARALAAKNAPAGDIEHLVVHTGQHYDTSMSDVFFRDLDLPVPAANLGVGSGSHGTQTAGMLTAIEGFLEQHRPDIVIVYGDTNSTLAGCLAATKMSIATAHVEAGLRSFNRRMPEELNRVATDHLSDLLLAPTDAAVENLEREGLGARTRLAGDVMLDALLHNIAIARRSSTVVRQLGLNDGDYAVATVHRASNTEPSALKELLAGLVKVAAQMPVVLPLHPRTRAALSTTDRLLHESSALRFIDPLPYLDMLRLVEGATVVLTDSGGLQKEAFMLGRPCVTLREETEWTETVEAGANILAGTGAGQLLEAINHWRARDWARHDELASKAMHCYGNGTAAELIAGAVVALASSSSAQCH